MSDPSAQVIRRGGKEEYAVLPWDEYQAMRQRIEDLEDLLAVRQAREDDNGTRYTLDEVKAELGLD